MGRFDYVKYDEETALTSVAFKTEFERLSDLVESVLKSPRAKALVQTKLEEAYMWVGKALRDDQIAKGVPAPLMEERNDTAVPAVEAPKVESPEVSVEVPVVEAPAVQEEQKPEAQ